MKIKEDRSRNILEALEKSLSHANSAHVFDPTS